MASYDCIISISLKKELHFEHQPSKFYNVSCIYLFQFNELQRLAGDVNTTSHEQQALAYSLLDEITCALENATQALELIDETIALQNATLAKVQQIEEDILPPLLEIYMEARGSFMAIARDAPLALTEARRLREAIRNISIPDFDVERGLRELDRLENEALELSLAASSVDKELNILQANFTILNSSATELLMESDRLNGLAQELLTIAHSAQALAYDSVEGGNTIIAEARDILSQLQRGLSDTDNFTVGLVEVLQNIELAETESVAAEEIVGQRAMDVVEIALRVNTAAETLQNASQTLQTAIEVRIVKMFPIMWW
jgi:predicted RNase H-like HicB family nuclease